MSDIEKRAEMSCFKPSPAVINYGKMNFLITHRPTNRTMASFIKEMKKHEVRLVIRVCEPSYNTDLLKENGIDVIDMQFSDGSPPPPEIIKSWIHLVKSSFKEHPSKSIAVHCVAGLGRAPVLVAIALMETGMDFEDAVEMIRTQRRGSFNRRQLSFLRNYDAICELYKLGHNGGKNLCSIQ